MSYVTGVPFPLSHRQNHQVEEISGRRSGREGNSNSAAATLWHTKDEVYYCTACNMHGHNQPESKCFLLGSPINEAHKNKQHSTLRTTNQPETTVGHSIASNHAKLQSSTRYNSRRLIGTNCYQT